jgi:phosphoenolpyruvate-protein phosphotransferase
MHMLTGTPASAGVAIGPLVVIRPPPFVAGGRISSEQADAEIARLAAAMEAAGSELEALAERVGAEHPAEAEIFFAHAMLAGDPALAEAAEDRIRAGDDAVAAIRAAGERFAAEYRAMDDELLAARATDILDVAGRIVDRLTGAGPAGSALECPSIIAAADLTPSLTATLPRERLLGIALAEGSATAHAAILARAYGIPAVVGIWGLAEAIEAAGGAASDTGRVVALDGTSGEVVLDPDAATLARFEQARMAAGAAAARALAEAALPAVTRDGLAVTLLANIGGPGESARAVELGARGVGLFRTEFLFLERTAPPSEEEQLTAYRAVVEAFAPHPVTIRLLDVGGDKPIPYLPIAPEANPFLGVRALRLAWDQPGIFLTQLRAAMRAAAGTPPGTVGVMAPMIADARDADLLLRLAVEARESLVAAGVAHGELALGVMLEIPAAILVGDTYLPRLAFASIGTNDLLQYTVAVDRGNRALARYQESLHPAVLRLVRQAVEACDAAGATLSVCGEMGGDAVAALALVGLGVRKLSMAASSLAGVRRAIRSADAAALDEAARIALAGPTAADVRAGLNALAARLPDREVSFADREGAALG